MLFKVTKEQDKKIRESIKKAKKPGDCTYTCIEDGEILPVCVIGQLAFLEGVTPSEMADWEAGGFSDSIHSLACEALVDYPIYLLSNLQQYWDASYGRTNEGLLKYYEGMSRVTLAGERQP